MIENSEFDWRDYIAINRDTNYLDETGKPTPYLLKRDPEFIKLVTNLMLAVRENERLVEKTLDQISLIPEVQSLIKGAAIVLREKAAKDSDLAKESSGKLRILVNDSGRTDFNPGKGIIDINCKDFSQFLYKTPFAYQDFSLQQALIHELEHGIDRSLGPDKDLAQMKTAMKNAVSSVFSFYPELKSEYDKTQTLMGRPVGDLFKAKSLDGFSKIFDDDILQGNHVLRQPDELDSFVHGKVAKTYKDEGVFGVLYSVYKRTYDDLIVKQDEMHVVKDTNTIIEKYFSGEPPRVSYETAAKPRAAFSRHDDTLPPLSPYIHADINPKRG